MRGAMSTIRADSAASLALAAARSPSLWLGLGLWGVGFLLWLRVLATEEISRVYPVVVGLSFLVVGVGSRVLFGETVPNGALAGSVLVVVGIALASREPSLVRQDP